MASVAQAIVDTLIAAKVRRIYGVVGDSLNALTDALRRSQAIEWIGVRHEEVAAFAAGADAHVTGELAVCAGSCGPGNMHLINGLYDCHRSRLPVLAIAAQIPSAELGTGYFQETRPDILFKDCSHFCEPVTQPAQIGRLLPIAIRTALGRRGVSVLTISGDVALREVDDDGPLLRADSVYPATDRGAELGPPTTSWRSWRRCCSKTGRRSPSWRGQAAPAPTTSWWRPRRRWRRRSCTRFAARSTSNTTTRTTRG